MNPKKLGKYPENELVDIPENDSPPQHVIHVWDAIASKAKAKDIVSVSHSAGGFFFLINFQTFRSWNCYAFKISPRCNEKITWYCIYRFSSFNAS